MGFRTMIGLAGLGFQSPIFFGFIFDFQGLVQSSRVKGSGYKDLEDLAWLALLIS